MILCDAGVLLCLVDVNQPYHQRYRSLVSQLNQPLITTWCCLTEAMYLAYRRAGWKCQQQLGKLILNQALIMHELPQDSFDRLLALMDRYQDRPMDLADATLVLVAEKTGYRQILTLDSDFLFYRIGSSQDSFEILTVDQ
jgi:predicted nucleic acid-binding protein